MQLRDHEAVVTKRDMFNIAPGKIKIEKGYNVRDLDTPEAKEKLAELKASIIANGVLQPVTVRVEGEDVYLVAGHRRLVAVDEAIMEGHEILTIPAIAEGKTVNEVERVLHLVTSNSGEPLTALETAEVVRRLYAFGWDRQQVAKRFGKSAQAIANYETLLGASEEVREMVRSGEVAPSTATAVVKKEGKKAGETLKKAKKEAKTKGKKKGKVTARAVAKSKGKSPLSSSQVEVLLSGLRKLATKSSCEVDREKANKLLHSLGLSVEE